MQPPTWRSSLLIGGDTVLIVASVLAATYIRLGPDAPAMLHGGDRFLRTALVVFLYQFSLSHTDLYDRQLWTGMRDLLGSLLRAMVSTAIGLALIRFWFPDAIMGRGVFLVASVLIVAAVAAWRCLFRWLSNKAAHERLLLVGTGPAAVNLARELHGRRQELGIDIVGFVDPDPRRLGAPVINPGVVGAIADIPRLVSELQADRVVVSLSDARGRLPMDRLLDVRVQSGVAFDHLASVYERYTGKIAVENLRPSWLIFSSGFRKGRFTLAAKRLCDLVFASVGLVVLSPVMLGIALIVRFGSPGPVLYDQERIGLNGRIFRVFKFRTMSENAEEMTGPIWSPVGDTRLIPLGAFLRRMRLDELPQLWNIIRGEMSIVGPRPERPEFVRLLTASIPFYGQRHVVKPGLTGWAQVRYTYTATIEDAVEKLQYDLYYLKHLSLTFDAFIMLQTVKTVLLQKGGR